MAGDWIKVRTGLKDHPKIISVAISLDIPEAYAVGCFVALWSWADSHTEDGNALSVSKTWIDRYLGVTNFAEEAEKVGWLTGEDGNLSLPNFEDHNGNTAKKRAQTARRVSRNKAAKLKESEENHGANAASVTESLPERYLEKRREEKNIVEPAAAASTGSALGIHPSLEMVEKFAKTSQGATLEIARQYYFDREAGGWMIKNSLIQNWKADFQAFVMRWNRNEHNRPGKSLNTSSQNPNQYK